MANSADLTYRMNSEARARAVLKDLSRICKEAGLKVKNASLQEAVARILGYDDWQQMLGSIGGHETVGPEDHELDHDTLMARRARQADALVRIGIHYVTAESVIARLRPTGRTGSAVEGARRLLALKNARDYHPYRFIGMWTELCDIITDFDRSTSGAEDLLAEWGEIRDMHPADQAVCQRDSSTNEELLDLYFRVTETSHVILDVSANAGELGKREVTSETYRNLPTMIADGIYVHFGANAFPSPYLHIGVEGAYVGAYGVDYDGGEAPAGIGIKLVCSVPFGDMLDADDWMSWDPVQDLRDYLRGPQIYVNPADGNTFAEEVASFVDEREYNPESGPWADFVAAPMAAAINAVKDYANRQLPAQDFLFGKVAPEVERSLERAATDDRLYRALGDLKLGHFMVRKFGDAPPAENAWKAYDASHLKVTAEHVEGLFQDIANHRGEQVLRPAAWAMEQAEKFSQQGNTPLHDYMGVSGRFFMLRTCLQAIAYNSAVDASLERGTQEIRDEAIKHVRFLVGDDKIVTLAHMPMLWLAARVFGLDDVAERAWEREMEHGRNILPDIREVVDYAISRNEKGDFAGVLSWLMEDPHGQAMQTVIRPMWDPWVSGWPEFDYAPDADEGAKP